MYLDSLMGFLNRINGIIWGWPPQIPLLVILLLGTGLFLTIRLHFLQIRGLGHGLRHLIKGPEKADTEGEISYFQALSAALSATVGVGNIAGVATAIHYGGPGALFWMWVTAVVGMTTKFAECMLANHYRVIHPDGSASGGPMYYIEKGLGKWWKPLAILFAVCAVISSFGSGNSVQAFTMADSFKSDFGIPPWVTGMVSATLVALVIIGGIKRIGHVASRLVPLMATLYVSAGLTILILNFGQIPAALMEIVTQAFQPRAGLAGAAGSAFMVTMIWGIKRGIFSNEAGQGSAAIAYAAAKTSDPMRAGLVSLLGPFIDTLIVCSITGLVIITEGSHLAPVSGQLLNGSPLTARAFSTGLAPILPWGNLIVTIAVFLFALSTAISWSYYGDRSAEYLFGPGAIRPYKYAFVLMHFMGAIFSLEIVWGFGDAALGLMALPNLIALIGLSGITARMVNNYFNPKSAGSGK
ncbi:alanine/glycine:cation symporter family protein [candidate division KSB1 bacterium]